MPLPGKLPLKSERGNRSARPLPLLTLIAVLTSCSMKISHSNGSTTYLGVVNIQEGEPADAPLVHSRRYGLMLDAGTSANSFALGYDDRLLVKPPTDKVTQIDFSLDSNCLSFQSH